MSHKNTEKQAIIKDIEQTAPLSPLQQLDCQTGFFGGQAGQIYRSWSGGRHRILGGEHGAFCYHVMSRTAGGAKIFGDVEKEGFCKIMRRMERFSGITILTHCILDNHFHILARVPEQKQFIKRFDDKEGETPGSGEARLLDHLHILYSNAYVDQVRREIDSMRERGMTDEAQHFLGKYKHRFCNLSLFIKELKERFSRWFNKKHQRKGTLWMDRFKSVLVEDGNALRTMSIYIDLNPVRAGIVEDPKDYRWCGYAEAVSGSKRARRGLCQVMGVPQDGGWSERTIKNPKGETVESLGGGARYRCWLMRDGTEFDTENNTARSGIPREKALPALAKQGVLSPAELLLSKIRHFTEGLVIGSQQFVEQHYQKHRETFSPLRKSGAKSIPEKQLFVPIYTLKGKLPTPPLE